MRIHTEEDFYTEKRQLKGLIYREPTPKYKKVAPEKIYTRNQQIKELVTPQKG